MRDQSANGPGSKPGPFGDRMEARGIEPRSETRSTTASTCVAHRLRSPAAGQWAAHCWTSLLEFRPAPEDAAPDYPDIAILEEPPRAGFSASKAVTLTRYAARARSVLAVVIFPSVLPGSRVPGH